MVPVEIRWCLIHIRHHLIVVILLLLLDYGVYNPPGQEFG